MTKQHSDVPATVDSESLGEEAAADGRAVEEVKQAEWQIIPTKRATVVAVSNKHGEVSRERRRQRCLSLRLAKAMAQIC